MGKTKTLLSRCVCVFPIGLSPHARSLNANEKGESRRAGVIGTQYSKPGSRG